MDDKGMIFEMLNDRFDRVEQKLEKNSEAIQELIKFKYTWVGRISIIAFIVSMVGAVVLVYIEKKLL